jgi:hypothetical protein
MMKRMFGFCGVCATAGVVAGPDSDINIVAPSSEAQAPLCQPTVLRGAVGIANGLSFGMQSNMASLSLFMMRQWLLA